MSKMHLRQPVFTFNTCGPFSKNKERTQKFKEAGGFSIYLSKRIR